MKPVGEKDDRDKRGRFITGNTGRPPGAVSSEKRELAQLCRDIILGNGTSVVGGDGLPDSTPGLLWLTAEHVFGMSNKSAAAAEVRIELLKLLAAYGWGKPPQKVILGDEDDSPDGILRRLMRERNERLRGGGATTGEGGGGDGGTSEERL